MEIDFFPCKIASFNPGFDIRKIPKISGGSQEGMKKLAFADIGSGMWEKIKTPTVNDWGFFISGI